MKKITLSVVMFLFLIFGVFITPTARAEVSANSTSVANSVVSTIPITPPITGGCMTVSAENRLACINNSLVELSSRVLKLESKTTINTTDKNTQSIPNTTPITNTTSISGVSSSASIKAVQSFLKTEGSFTYPTATGYYGDITIEALKKYQEKNGLPITGKIDGATLTKIQADVVQIAPALNAEISGINK